MYEQQPIGEQQEVEPKQGGFSSISASQRGFIAAILLAMIGLVIYGIHQKNAANAMAQQNAQITSALGETRGQVDALTSKMNTMLEQQQRAAEQQAQQLAAQKRVTGRVVIARRKADDARWKKVQSQLDDVDKKIGDTQSDLASAKTELGGSIARTHDELVVLQRRGEKNYFEFDITKAKQYSKAGPVSVSLRKANTKHDYADLELMVDDAHVSQKHVNLYQPVMFYAGDNGSPVELVINTISKNHIHGYISAPKYRQSELAAMSQATQQAQNNAQAGTQTTAQNAATAQVPARRKLKLPEE